LTLSGAAQCRACSTPMPTEYALSGVIGSSLAVRNLLLFHVPSYE